MKTIYKKSIKLNKRHTDQNLKLIPALLVIVVLFSAPILNAQALQNDNFFLHENGVTVMCP
ncbi:MAG: hypothetical protein LAT67_02705, partial [Balneolales bacterium]|nr:hypothetical protein [Balneolales bacterium]